MKLLIVAITTFYFLLVQIKNMRARIRQSERVYKDDISYQ